MSEIDDLTRAARYAADGVAAGARSAIDALAWLDASIQDDRAAVRFDEWGASTVMDENTGTAVIPRALFEELHRRAGLKATWPIGNAGLLHCYGYLLSLERTPYGLKRDRWIGDELADAYGLGAGAFLPWRAGATLLERATTAASALLVDPAVERPIAIDGRATRAALSAASGPAALVYAVAPAPGSAPLMVTTFPVSDARAILAEVDAEHRIRWNAV